MAITKSESKEQIERLVNNFDNHIAEYKQGIYNETKTRRDFIDPFLSALGWDVDNKQNLAESYREVIHEDKIKIDNSSRAPDYCITINGNKKFYVEAKKPSISLIDSISSAYQLRRYGWNAKMPISIITDFEEFSVYDCQVKPNNDDKATIARIKYITYKDYLNEFDFLWDTFSKESVRNGSLEKYFQSTKGKRASSSVDEEFLKSLDSWRDLLAKNLVLRNPSINEDQLNFSLQKLIDRIIFLRISEDRGVEDQNQLLNAIGKNTYSNLRKLFHIADQKYNSGLFDYKKDVITDTLIIDNEILQQIIEEMYYPKSPYEFSVIPVEILGHSYEQYLGKTITIESNHKIKIEVKPEVRKAGGVYYTPQYIVDYIVRNTLGKLLEGSGNQLSVSGEQVSVSGYRVSDKEVKNNFENTMEIFEDGIEKGDKNLSGFGGMEVGDGHNSRNIQDNDGVSETRDLWINESNPASSCFDSGKHSGRTGEDSYQGIHQSSFDSKRFTDRIGNSPNISSETGLHKQGESSSHMEQSSKYRQNVESTNKIITGSQEKLNQIMYDEFHDKGEGYQVTGFGCQPNNPAPITQNPKPKTRKPLTPEDVAKIKICDPACGSGSFLLGAYQYLLNWHTDYYNKSKIKNKSKYLTPDGNLTTSVKKEILLNNIYGVDIDTNAVEVTKLSLMIKAMEGETKSSINHQLTAFHERILPTLDNNIKCGNSLIGSDFYLDNRPSLFSDKEKRKINTFDWEKEFPTIFKSDKSDKSQNIKKQLKTHINAASNYIDGARFHVDKAKQYIDELIEQSIREDTIEYQSLDKSGFDVIIGNPPYVDFRSIDENQKQYLIDKYYSTKVKEKWSLFIPFLEKSSRLLNENGKFGFIIPNNFLVSDFGIGIRKYLLKNVHINRIIDVSRFKVFGKVSTYPILFFFQKPVNKNSFIEISYPEDLADLYKDEFNFIMTKDINEESNKYQISTSLTISNLSILDKIEKNTLKLHNFCENFIWGTSITGFKKFKIQTSDYNDLNPKEKVKFNKVIQTADIKRYCIDWQGEYIDKSIYSTNVIDEFNKLKIVIARVTRNIQAHLDTEFYYLGKSSLLTGIKINDKFLLALLNSKLLNYYYFIKYENTHMSGGYLRFDIPYLKELPIRNIDLSNRKEKIIHDNLVDLVEQMLENKKYFLNSEMDADKKMYSNICDSLDKKIDQLVYQLYGLTDEEIKVVEGNN